MKPEYDYDGNRIKGGMQVIGYAEKPLELSADPQYENFKAAGVIGKVLEGVNEKLDTQFAEGGQMFGGLNTYQVFKGASHFSFSFQIRVINTGGGEPIEYAKTLISWCQPHDLTVAGALEAFEREKLIDLHVAEQQATKLASAFEGGLWETIKDGFYALGGAVDQAIEEGPVAAAKAAGEKALKVAKDVAAGTAEMIDNNYLEKVRAGISKHRVKFWFGDMVKNLDSIIKSVKVEFSQEQTETGPLYANINIDMQTFKVLTEKETRETFFAPSTSSSANITYKDIQSGVEQSIRG